MLFEFSHSRFPRMQDKREWEFKIRFNAVLHPIFIHTTPCPIIFCQFFKLLPTYTDKLGLNSLDFTMWSICWVASITYAYKIVPPTLVGTMSSILAVLYYIIFKSIGSITGGQLISKLDFDLPDVFRVSAGFTLGIGVIYVLFYYTLARQRENIIIEKLDEKYPERNIEKYKSEETVESCNL